MAISEDGRSRTTSDGEGWLRLNTVAVGDVGTRLSTLGRFSRAPLAAPSRM